MTTTQYDSHGNVAQVSTDGSALAAGSLVVSTYAIDESQWQLALMASRIEYADVGQTQILNQDKFTFDPASWKVETHSRWNNVADCWLQRVCGYDAFRNLTSSTDSTGSVTTTAYDTEFHSFPATTTSSPAPGTILTQTTVYEPSFGHAVSVTDAAGSVQTRSVDGLGRTAAEARTVPDGTLVEARRIGWSTVNGTLCKQTSQRLDWSSDLYRWLG